MGIDTQLTRKKTNPATEGIQEWKVHKISHQTDGLELTFHITLLVYDGEDPVMRNLDFPIAYDDKNIMEKISSLCDYEKIRKERTGLINYIVVQYNNFALAIQCRKYLYLIDQIEVPLIFQLCWEEIEREKSQYEEEINESHNHDSIHVEMKITPELFESVLERKTEELSAMINRDIEYIDRDPPLGYDRDSLKETFKSCIDENLTFKTAVLKLEGLKLIDQGKAERAKASNKLPLRLIYNKLSDKVQLGASTYRIFGRALTSRPTLLDGQLDDDKPERKTQSKVVKTLNNVRTQADKKPEIIGEDPRLEEDLLLIEKCKEDIQESCGYCKDVPRPFAEEIDLTQAENTIVTNFDRSGFEDRDMLKKQKSGEDGEIDFRAPVLFGEKLTIPTKKKTLNVNRSRQDDARSEGEPEAEIDVGGH